MTAAANTLNPGSPLDALVAQAQRQHARRMARLLIRFNLHPEDDVHPSWWPHDWRASAPGLPALGARGLGAAGRAAFGARLRHAWRSGVLPGEGFDADFASPSKRLALMDGPAQRLLAWHLGVALHRPLLGERALGARLQRQFRRLDPGSKADAQRLPALQTLHPNKALLIARPGGLGRVVWHRGARLLQALLAPQGEATLARVRLKLPRTLVQAGSLPALTPAQRRELDELARLHLIPERLPSWDWLF